MKRIVLITFICLTLACLLVAVPLYIRCQQFIGEFGSQPAPIADFYRGLLNDFFWRIIGFIVLVVYSAYAAFVIFLTIGNLMNPVIDASLTRIFPVDSRLIEASKQLTGEVPKKLTKRNLSLLSVIIIGLLWIFRGSVFSSVYLMMAFVIAISCLLCIFLFRWYMVGLLKKVGEIKESELLKYQGYSLLQILIVGLFIVLATLCIVALANFVAEHSARLFWGNFYDQWESRVDTIYLQYPDLFGQTREEFLSDLSSLVMTLQADSSSIVAHLLPKNTLQFIYVVVIMLFSAMGLPFMLFSTQYFGGMKGTLAYVLIPILVGLLFLSLGLVVPLPQESVIVASIAIVIANYLLTFLFQNLLMRK